MQPALQPEPGAALLSRQLQQALDVIDSRPPGPDEPYEPRGPWTGFSRVAPEQEPDTGVPVEDLAQLDSGGVQTLLRGVDKDKLGIALKGASDSLKDLFFTNMSERAAKILREDMAAMGPVRLSDVDDAQLEIVNVAKQLAEQGEIMLSDGGEEDALVY